MLVHDASYYTALQLEGPEVVYFSFSFSFFVGIFFFFIVIHLSLKDTLNCCSDSNISNNYCGLSARKSNGLIFLVLFKADSCIQDSLMSVLRMVLEPYLATATHPGNHDDSVLSSVTYGSAMVGDLLLTPVTAWLVWLN